VVLSCLADGPAVEAVYLGKGNVLRSARPGNRIIELSTISPNTSRHLHRPAQQFDLSALDVAVSGSTPTAEAGALTLFGGGERKVISATTSPRRTGGAGKGVCPVVVLLNHWLARRCTSARSCSV
jgi:3-hydroxyisobutyrate dehydrogenase-like beta-hydroxyacid dehydrogenase